LLLSGVQLLILGIIGEYLGRLYLTANRRPQSVVKEVQHNEPRDPTPNESSFLSPLTVTASKNFAG
jgi:undecaprenyl-phosphate 4-deoxy-4-formamido-L-arabinose transferase